MMLGSVVRLTVALPVTNKRNVTMTRSEKTGRILHCYLSSILRSAARCTSAATLAAFLQLPAFFSSCNRPTSFTPAEAPVYTSLRWSKAPAPEAVDLFFFETYGSELLDAYQQVVEPDRTQPIYGMCALGAKRLVALSGMAGETARWADIRTYGNLQKHVFSLADESVRTPRLWGQMHLEEGASRQCVLEMNPLLAAIRFRSVSCDFFGRPYAGKKMQLTQLFLTYAGSEYRPLEGGDGEPVSWVNPGYLDTLALQDFQEPSMVWQKGPGAVGMEAIYPEQTFYCYPGSRTHLVLEARYDTLTCYYPISLPQLVANTCLQLDITLRRLGSADPDTPTVSDAVSLYTQQIPWEKREPSVVTY